MPTLLLRFPGGRYHATPAGHHVNEGLIEWPPSPWRLLRGLLATGYATLHWPGDLADPLAGNPPPQTRALIEKLAATLPRYRLPQAVGTHSRHYMPLGVLVKGREKTTLVFDTWARIGDGELAVSWDVELEPAETRLLGELAERMGYLGRSESWISACLLSDDEPPLTGDLCLPAEAQPMPGPGWEQVALLAPEPPAGFAAWREQALSQALAPFPLPEKKPPKKLVEQRAKAAAPYPPDLIACLQADTTWLRSHGWSQPPGSRKVLYWRPVDSLEAGSPRPAYPAPRPRPVQAMLLSLATQSGNDHALPAVTRTLPQAELLHQALVGVASKLGGHSAVLSGCDAQHNPLQGRHEHAHILPLDLDGDGHLEHLLIWATMGLDADAQTAIRTIRQTFTKGGMAPLKLALAAAGGLDDLRRLSGDWGTALRRLLPDAPGARDWVSRTPFVAPRHLKAKGRHSLEGQVAAELASRGLPELSELQVIDPREDPSLLRQRHFVRIRRNGPPPPIDFGYSLRLRLAEPWNGPLSLGYGSHFGLGMFSAVPEG
jgi:CRISPR-associated protein Csb2